MSNLQSEVFEAFTALGVDQAKALRPAEALSHRDDDVGKIRVELALLRWMVGGLYVIAVPGIWLIVRLAFKAGIM